MARRAYIKQAAEELGVSEHFLRTGARAGEIPCFKSGNRYIFDIQQCKEYLKHKAMENVNRVEEPVKQYGVLRKVGV